MASLQKVLKNYHFWVILAMFAIAVIIHYPQQILSTESTSLFSSIGLTRHAVERILLLLPVAYAGFLFGTRAGLASLAIALAVMLPRDIFLSEYLPDAILETSVITMIGGLVNFLFHLHRSDIAKIRISAKALKESDKMLNLISEASADIIMILDIDFKIRFVSHTEQGFTKDQVLGKYVYAYISKEQQEMVKGYLEKAIEIQTPVYYETEYVHPDGNIANYETIASPIIADDKVTGFIATSRDITERKKTDEALHNSEQKYRSLVGNVSLGIFRSTPGINGVFLEVNPAMQEITGYTREELLQMRVCDLYVNPDEREHVLEEVALQKRTLTKELRFKKKDGTQIIVSDTKALVRDSEGEILYFDGILEDITERKKIDEALKLAYTEIEQIFETTTCGICVIDTDFNILQCNRAFSNFLKLPRGKILNNKCYDVFHHKLCNTTKCALRRVIDGEERIESDFMKKTAEGDSVYLSLTATPYKQPDGKLLGIIESFNDITQLKKADENLHFYLHEITQAQEDERKRISRELHDSTTQNLIALLRQLENFVNNNKGLSPRHTETLWDFYEQIKYILKELRRFSRDLRPSVLDDLGLIPALEWVTAGLSTEYGLDIRLKVSGDKHRLSKETELLLFRIVQEALRNVAKHADTSKAEVKVDFQKDKISITVSDKGVGFQFPTQMGSLLEKSKLGLMGMQERVRLLNGSLNIVSEPGKGTDVFVDVPI